MRESNGVSGLEQARNDASAHVASLRRAHSDIVQSTDSANTDDEHDPEGATIAFEREQLTALIAVGERTVRQLDEAMVQQAEGSYGTCVLCGSSIAAQRLEALPTATTCISCARTTETTSVVCGARRRPR